LGTAYTTLICCIAKAVLDHKYLITEQSPLLYRWSSALGDVIVVLSDQQVVTGISIIVGAVSQLQSGIPIYHWQSAVNLAWFSTVTHLITLTVLRDEVRSNKPIRIFRLVGMTVLMLMLVCVMATVGYLVTESPPPPHFPAWCLYHSSQNWKFLDTLEGDISGTKFYNTFYIAPVIGVLIYTFVTRMVLLSFNSTDISRFVLRISQGQPRKSMESVILRLKDKEPRKTFMKLMKIVVYKLVCSVYALIVSGSDLYCSRAWEVCLFSNIRLRSS